MQKRNFKINNEIYSDNIILNWIKDFENIEKISYKNNILSIESEWNIDEIFNEFMNYLVFLYNDVN